MKSPSGGQPIFTVSELNRHARLLLEERFNLVWVRGEMSNFRRPGSGHWYFTLKDEQGQIGCAMFINRNRQARMQPRDGVEVIIRGRVSLYEARGNYQIIVDAIEPAGEGALRIAFEALKDKLAAEGMFAAERKRALPALPSRLAIISSASGAALRDVLAVVRRRYPALAVTLLPVAVQGDEAERQILRALERAPATSADLVLLTRGGGSLEDLWAFNLESVARAVAACPLPTVVAIGHETDWTLMDLAADERAPTPTAAAEMAVPVRADLLAQVEDGSARMAAAWGRVFEDGRTRLEGLVRGLPDIRRLTEDFVQRLDDWTERLINASGAGMESRRAELARLAAEIPKPHQQLAHARSRLKSEARALAAAAKGVFRECRRSLKQAGQLLESYSYERVLERGFAMVADDAGQPVATASRLSPGMEVTMRFHDGQAGATVTNVKGQGGKGGKQKKKKKPKPKKGQGGDGRQGTLL